MRERKEMGSLELAYLGDAVYELEVRKHLLENDWGSPGEMNRKALFYVTAQAQARAAETILSSLTEEEAEVFRRGRNAHPKAAPKHADPGAYALATGLEAVFGFLFLGDGTERIARLFALCRKALEEKKD